jgi:hypothetical protein
MAADSPCVLQGLTSFDEMLAAYANVLREAAGAVRVNRS